MKRYLRRALFPLLLAGAGAAEAGMMDLINGKMVGKQLPYAELQFVGNKVVVENKALLIDFWASWCEPCRDFIPELNRMHGDYAAKGLVVVGLTQDEPADIASFVKKIPIDFHIARDSKGAIFKGLKVRAMPYSILVDRGGNIIWQGDPAELKRAQLDALLSAI
ncbi:TlpA family protein disulfide reductase [Oxalobacteraceae bacterium]|nr:TlpA family protein disulfide reductase [Oxalobacteraceae bacterium]